jgi:peroxiredoxin
MDFVTSKFRSFVAAGLVCCLQDLVLSQQPAASQSLAVATASNPADAAFAAFQSLRKSSPPAQGNDQQTIALWKDRQQQAIIKAGVDFYKANPADPRRWEVVQVLSTTTPSFIKGFLGKGTVFIQDEVAYNAWKAKRESLVQAMASATDVPTVTREALDWAAFSESLRSSAHEFKAGKPVNWAAFRPRFDAHVAKYVQLGTATLRAEEYLGFLELNVPGASLTEWAHLKASTPSETLRVHAVAQLERAEFLSKPLDLAFTAVDGRTVDMKALRGKVVLVDFWAMWCGPCIAELPNIKAVYSKYHTQGFDIIGISLDRAADRQKLIDFVEKEKMPWPQHFDGGHVKNAYAVQYGIRSIPSMFLVDQTGRIVTSNARGPALEAHVARLLAK